jgi:hypothetical protein
VLAALVACRIVLWISLPWLLNRTVQPYGLSSSYERLTLSLLTMDMEARHLVLTAKDVAEPLADMEYFRAHVSPWSLAVGRLLIYRVEVDGMEVLLLRNNRGTWRGCEGIVNLLTRRPEPLRQAAPQAGDQKQRPATLLTSLRPPLDLEGLSLHHLVVRFRDEVVSPAVEARLDMNIRLSDVGSTSRKTAFQMLVSCQPILDHVVLEGVVAAGDRKLDATFSCSGRGLRLEPVRPYLELLGLEPQASTIDFGCTTDAHLALSEPNSPAADANTSPSARPRILHCQADLADLQVVADGLTDLGLGRLSLDASVGPGRVLQIRRIEIADGQAQIRRTRPQGLDVAGLRVVMGRGTGARRASSTPTAQEPPSQPQPLAMGWQWAVEGVRLERLGLSWQDRVTKPETAAALRLDQARIGRIQAGSGPGQAGTPIQVRLLGPGVFESCDVEGLADLVSPIKTLDVDLRVQGLSFKALAAYLDQAGLESEYNAGRLTCHVTATAGPRPSDGLLGGDLSIRGLRLEDRGELFALDGLNVSGVQWDPGRSRLRLETVEIAGQRMTVGRDSRGLFRVLGFRLRAPADAGRSSGPGTARQDSAAGQPASGRAVLVRSGRLEIGRLVWRDNEILLEDAAVSAKPKVLRARFGAELADLVLDLAEPNAAPGPARYEAVLQVPPLVGQFRVKGSLTGQSPYGWRTNLSVVGQGIDTREAAEYLRPLGLEPLISQGDLAAEAEVDLSFGAEGPILSAAVQKLMVHDGDQMLAGLDLLRIRDLLAGPVTRIAEIQVTGPQVTLGRDPNGALVVCGVRVTPVPHDKKPSSRPRSPSASAVHVDHLAIQEGRVRWLDQALASTLDITAQYQVDLNDLTLGATGSPAGLKAVVQAPPLADRLEVSGSLFTAPARQGADLIIEGAGLCAGPLAAYLPAGVAPGLDRGQLHLAVLGLVESGPHGERLAFQVRDLDLRETGGSQPLLHVDQFRTRVSRQEPNVVSLEECSLLGLEASVERLDPTTVSLLGLRLCSTRAGSTRTASGSGPSGSAAQAAEGRPSDQRVHLAKVPDVVVESLDLRARRISWIDRVVTGAAPLSVEDLRIRNSSAWRMQGQSPQDSGPIPLEATCRVSPLIDDLQVHAQVAPLAQEPNLTVDLAARGVRGSGLTLIRPDLTDVLDGSDLKAGTITGRIEAVLEVQRRNPFDYDLRRPFGVSLRITGLQVTEANEPAALAGLGQLQIEAPSVDLVRHKAQIKRIEVVGPQCRLAREPNGVRVLGILLRLAAGSRDPNVAKAARVPAGQIHTQPDAKPAFDWAVDQLVVSGLDVSWSDATVEPRLEVPLTGLDLEVRGLSSRLRSEPVPIKFNVVLTSGPVHLGTGEDRRALFQEAALVGRLTAGPSPSGWVKASLSGLDLRGLRGPINAQGVTLNEGVLDAGLDMRLGAGKAQTRLNVVLTDLSMTEPAEGPLLHLLRLPVPLDTALFMLRGPDGSIRLPLQFTATDKGVSHSQMTQAAVGAAASVIAEALAGAALRPAAALASVLGGGSAKEPLQRTLEIGYSAGNIDLADKERLELQAIARRLQRDRRLSLTIRHQLGSQDMAAAEALVNPPAAERQALLGQLRSQRQMALDLRSRLAARAYLARVSDETSTVQQAADELSDVTRRLALLDRSIDAVIETLRPGAEHAARRRTREAALLISQTRLDMVAEILGLNRTPELAAKINLTAPSLAVVEGQTQSRIVVTMTLVKGR